jgi:hypothetical protein
MATGSPPAPARGARRRGEAAVYRPEFEWLARAGLVARGVVYGTIGILALKLALGSGGRTTSQQGALKTIAREPFGRVLLIAVTVGLAGYAIWRLLRAAVGHGTQEQDSGFNRVAGAVSGVVYAALCVTGVEILIGGSSSGGSGSPRTATGGVLSWTGGTVIVGAAGAVLIGVAIFQGYKGVARKFLDSSNVAEMSPAVKRAFTAIGVLGHLARMVVFALIGFGLIKAAADYNPHKAIGLDGALSKLAHDSDGAVLLGLVAAGLIAFALYSIADARYRKI